jgi:hypothetical protein
VEQKTDGDFKATIKGKERRELRKKGPLTVRCAMSFP